MTQTLFLRCFFTHCSITKHLQVTSSYHWALIISFGNFFEWEPKAGVKSHCYFELQQWKHVKTFMWYNFDQRKTIVHLKISCCCYQSMKRKFQKFMLKVKSLYFENGWEWKGHSHSFGMDKSTISRIFAAILVSSTTLKFLRRPPKRRPQNPTEPIKLIVLVKKPETTVHTFWPCPFWIKQEWYIQIEGPLGNVDQTANSPAIAESEPQRQHKTLFLQYKVPPLDRLRQSIFWRWSHNLSINSGQSNGRKFLITLCCNSPLHSGLYQSTTSTAKRSVGESRKTLLRTWTSLAILSLGQSVWSLINNIHTWDWGHVGRSQICCLYGRRKAGKGVSDPKEHLCVSRGEKGHERRLPDDHHWASRETLSSFGNSQQDQLCPCWAVKDRKEEIDQNADSDHATDHD